MGQWSGVLSDYKHIIGYGIGQYYDYVNSFLPADIKLDYLCDIRWKEFPGELDGIRVISPDELREVQDAVVIVFSNNQQSYCSITRNLERMALPYVHVDQLLERRRTISGRELRESGNEIYEDKWGNCIEFCSDIEDEIRIHFHGENNRVILGKELRVGGLDIFCERNALCRIGDCTEIDSARIFVTDGSIEVGKDCLFACGIILRNHDGHHIFDKASGRRLNYAGNIKIGNHVWLGESAVLLGNASVGDNSVVGMMAVTSSSFPGGTVLAGNPARIIKRDICWSKDTTYLYNRDFFDECHEKKAQKYF